MAKTTLPKIYVPLIATVFVLLFMWLSAVPILSWFEQSADYQQLDDATFHWHHEGIRDYSFEFDVSGPIDLPFRLPVRVHVRDGSFERAYEVDSGRAIDISGQNTVPSGVDAAFAMVAQLLEERPYSLDVRYDAMLHYPNRISVRHDESDRSPVTYYLRAFRESRPER